MMTDELKDGAKVRAALVDDNSGPEHNYLLPPEHCELVTRILGAPPTLDPCGHPDQFLDIDGRILFGTCDEDDGMLLPWTGERVVLNAGHGERAPKETPNFKWYPLSRWVTKAQLEAQRGATILALLPANTDRAWFHEVVAPTATAIAFLSKRVKSFVPDKTGRGEPRRAPQPMQAHMYVLWTNDPAIADRFYAALGAVSEAGGEEVAPMAFVVEPNPL